MPIPAEARFWIARALGLWRRGWTSLRTRGLAASWRRLDLHFSDELIDVVAQGFDIASVADQQPTAFAALIRSDLEKWPAIIKASGGHYRLVPTGKRALNYDLWASAREEWTH